MRFRWIWIVAFVAVLVVPGNALAQEDEPLWDQFVDTFKTEPFTLAGMVQVFADVQPERADGDANRFGIQNARLQIMGKLDYGFHYFIQADFDSAVSMLDALAGWQPIPEFGVQAGYYRTPFGGEFLTGITAIPFINRGRFAGLVPNRQVGFDFHGGFWDGALTYAVGMFNGNGDRFDNDSNAFMYVGRLVFNWEFGRYGEALNRIEVGANAGWSKDEEVSWFRFRGDAPWAGERTFVGGDFKLELFNVLFSGELIAVFLDPEEEELPEEEETMPLGYHLTLGYTLPVPVQVLVRWDALSADEFDNLDHQLLLGLNYWPSTPFELQFNYIYSLDDDRFETAGEQHQFLMSAQVAF